METFIILCRLGKLIINTLRCTEIAYLTRLEVNIDNSLWKSRL